MDSIISPVAQRPIFVDSTAVDLTQRQAGQESAISANVHRRENELQSQIADRQELFISDGVAWAGQTISSGGATWRMLVADDGRVAFFSMDAMTSLAGRGELKGLRQDSQAMVSKLLPADDNYSFFVCC